MTYYEMLGIAQDASRNDVKRAYFTLVKKYSPEKNPEEFKEIRKAYEVLYDTSARAAYDGMVSLPEEYAKIYASGCELLEENYYDDGVVAKLKKAIEEKPDLYALSNVLGQIYLANDNSGNAVKIYETLISQQPENVDYRVKLAESYLKRGFHKKALAEYQELISKSRDNAALWAGLCAAYVAAGNLKSAKQTLSDGFAAVEASGGDVIELNVAAIRLYITDENGCSEVQRHIDILSARFDEDSALKPLLMSALRTIVSIKTFKSLPKGSQFSKTNLMAILKFMLKIEPGKELEELLEIISADETMSKIKQDENVPEFAFILTDIKMSGGEDEPEGKVALAVWESECLWDIETSRRQLRYFRENYPDQYAMHKNFYDRVLDPKKEHRLYYEADSKIKTVSRQYPDLFEKMTGGKPDDNKFGGNLETSNTPFKRETPKVGRNDPCPCGSGKKYKKCCGA